MPDVTRVVSAPLVRRCIDHAREHRFPVLVEGTFRDAAAALGTARDFRSAGFTVHAVVLAVPRQVSRPAALNRFQSLPEAGMARWTPMTAHDASLAALPASAEAMGAASVVDRLVVADRDGLILLDSAEPGPDRARDARFVVEAVHSRTEPLDWQASLDLDDAESSDPPHEFARDG